MGLWASELVAAFLSFPFLSFPLSLVAPALSFVAFLVGFRPCRWVVLVGGAGLPLSLVPFLVGFRSLLAGSIGSTCTHRGGSDYREHPEQVKTAQNRLKRGKN